MKQCYSLKDFYISRTLYVCRFSNKNVYRVLAEEPGVAGFDELGVLSFMNIEITGHMCEIRGRDFPSLHRTNCDLVTDSVSSVR